MEIINPEDVKLKLLIDQANVDEEELTYKIFLDKNFSFKNIEGREKHEKKLKTVIQDIFHQGYSTYLNLVGNNTH